MRHRPARTLASWVDYVAQIAPSSHRLIAALEVPTSLAGTPNACTQQVRETWRLAVLALDEPLATGERLGEVIGVSHIKNLASARNAKQKGRRQHASPHDRPCR